MFIYKVKPWFSNFSLNQDHLQGFVKIQMAVPAQGVSDSINQRENMRTCISSKFPGDAGTAVKEIHILEPLSL